MSVVGCANKNSLKINRFHSICTILVRDNFGGHAHGANASQILGQAKLKIPFIVCQFLSVSDCCEAEKKALYGYTAMLNFPTETNTYVAASQAGD